VNSPGGLQALERANDKSNRDHLWFKIGVPLIGWEIASQPNSYHFLSNQQKRFRTFPRIFDLNTLSNDELDMLVLLAYFQADPLPFHDFRNVCQRCWKHRKHGRDARELLQDKLDENKFLFGAFSRSHQALPSVDPIIGQYLFIGNWTELSTRNRCSKQYVSHSTSRTTAVCRQSTTSTDFRSAFARFVATILFSPPQHALGPDTHALVPTNR
jgi:hypothetical protein